jgi:hypothetical protein
MIINAKFASVCTECNGRIKVNEPINWVRGQRGASHAVPATCAAFRTAPPVPVAVVGIAGIVAFLTSAAERGLKHPKARFLSPQNEEMRLALAGERSRNPGSVQIKIAGEWIGGILTDGRPTGPIGEMRDVLDTLVAIAEDPVSAARAYGALMCRCSFCNLHLTDEGSVEVGYGPICAVSYNLPWVRLGVPVLTMIPEAPIEPLSYGRAKSDLEILGNAPVDVPLTDEEREALSRLLEGMPE